MRINRKDCTDGCKDIIVSSQDEYISVKNHIREAINELSKINDSDIAKEAIVNLSVVLFELS